MIRLKPHPIRNRPVSQLHRRPKATHRPRLIVMAKAAVMGRCKTRLAHEIGPTEAVRFYRATRRSVLLRLMRDPRYETVVAMDPPSAIRDPSLPRGIKRLAQTRLDLGTRMQRLIEAKGSAPTIVIGSDIPGVTPDAVAQAFCALRGARVVIGPAPDGGLWLYGARACPAMPKPFVGVRWSETDTLTNVLNNLNGIQTAAAVTLSDVDSAKDLKRAELFIGRIIFRRHPLPGRLASALTMAQPKS